MYISVQINWLTSVKSLYRNPRIMLLPINMGMGLTILITWLFKFLEMIKFVSMGKFYVHDVTLPLLQR